MCISFLVMFLGVSTELHQFLRLPVLIHHFIDHYQEDSSTSFTDFLGLHYTSTETHSDNEHHDHDKLPFKTASCAMAHIAIAFVNHIQLSLPSPNSIEAKESAEYAGEFYSSAFLNTIWQPPKFS